MKTPCFPSISSHNVVSFLYGRNIRQLPFELSCILCPRIVKTKKRTIVLFPPSNQDSDQYIQCLESLFNSFEYQPFEIDNSNASCYYIIGKQLDRPDFQR
jgi:hypothetical protein